MRRIDLGTLDESEQIYWFLLGPKMNFAKKKFMKKEFCKIGITKNAKFKKITKTKRKFSILFDFIKDGLPKYTTSVHS